MVQQPVPFERRQLLRILSLLRVDLPEVYVGADIVWVKLQDLLEWANCFVHACLRFCDQTENVVRLGCVWRERGCCLCFPLRSRKVRFVVKSDREVDFRECQFRINLKRSLESVRAILVLELFEQRYARLLAR